MHSGFEIPGIQQQQQEQDNNCAPVYISTNPTHILDQIHSLPATQQLFLDQHHFLPPHHHYVGGAAAAYFPVNFKLGLNEVCSRNHDYSKDGSVSSSINGGEDLLRGSEHYPQPRHSSLGMLHCWQSQQDSPNKQSTPNFWEPLPSEVSNGNSEIVDRQEHFEMNNQKSPHLTHCLDSKSRLHFGELEAIYKRLDTAESIQTCPSSDHHNINPPVNPHSLPLSEEEEASAPIKDVAKKKTKKKTKKKESGYSQLISPMTDFFGDLVKKVMDHQENLQMKFTQVIERLEEERRGREEAWRNQELAHFEREAAARAHDKAVAMSREAMIVSYLEKITGERINFPAFDPMEIATTTSDDCGGNDEHDEAR